MSRTTDPTLELLLRLGDDRLLLAQRLGQWCGRGPTLEEDVALTNVALDLFGHTSALLRLAGELEGEGRSEDDLAFFREAIEFRNVLLVEQPRGDFGVTIARQYVFDVYSFYTWEGLCRSTFAPLAAIAQKATKESQYHVRHSGEWTVRLGDGTEESHERMQAAFDQVWRFTGELFESDEVSVRLVAAGVAPDPATVRERWLETVSKTLARATLRVPDSGQFMISGGRRGRHGEHLGYLLAEMQILQRSYPGCNW